MHRRTFIRSAASGLVAAASLSAAPAEVIDTHVHFYDPRRPGGVPWPPKDDALLYHPVYPDDFRKVAGPFGITSVVEVEASPLIEDNQWVLDLAAKDSLVIATVGHLEPDAPDFHKQLDRFTHNPRFRGIRYGNLWNRNVGDQLANPKFVEGLKVLASAQMAMDSANPNPKLLADLVRVSDKVPSLRIVVDHLPIDPPSGAGEKAQLAGTLRELSNRPEVYVKVSNIARRVDGRVREDLDFYKPALDELWDLFGANRLLYGSNWPVSDKVAPYQTVFKLAHDYFSTKGSEARARYFAANARHAYRIA
jgi:L-fuconolactonase